VNEKVLKLDIIQAIISGLLQGLLEWVPVSSEGILLIFFSLIGEDITLAFIFAVAMHLPTGIAAIVYFKSEYYQILRDICNGHREGLIQYIIYATGATVVTAVPLYIIYREFLRNLEDLLKFYSAAILVIVGITMIVVGSLLKNVNKEGGYKDLTSGTRKDYILVGLIQGIAILPGVTRSGVTIAALVWRKFQKEDVIRGSFILAPIVSIGAFVVELIFGDFQASALKETWLIIAFITALITSIMSIKIMLEIAKKLEYWKLLIVIGLIMVALNMIYVI